MNHRTCTSLICLAFAYTLFATAIGLAEQEDFVVFNHSRESLTLRDVSFQDESRTTNKPALECASGERLLLLKEPELARKVQNVSFRIELPDRTVSEKISVLRDHSQYFVTSANISKWREGQPGISKSKGEKTYRYWMTILQIAVDQERMKKQLDDVNAVSTLDPAKKLAMILGMIRDLGDRMVACDTEGVDQDAIDAVSTLAQIFYDSAEMMNRTTTDVGPAIGRLFRGDTSKFMELIESPHVLSKGAAKSLRSIAAARKQLTSRYKIAFPPLIAPCQITLIPFSWSKGHYVSITNACGEDLKGVSIRYTDPSGNYKTQDVASIVPFGGGSVIGLESVSPSFKVNPGDVKWTVETHEAITVLFEGGSFSIPTDPFFTGTKSK